jgi:hypothetical protein
MYIYICIYIYIYITSCFVYLYNVLSYSEGNIQIEIICKTTIFRRVTQAR